MYFQTIFCAVRVDVKQSGGQISNVEPTCVLSTCTQYIWITPQKQKQFIENHLSKFSLSRNGAYPKFTVSVYFSLGQISPLKVQNIATKLKLFKTLHPQLRQPQLSTNTISGSRIFCKLCATVLYHNNT